jgi:hypothetical protein
MSTVKPSSFEVMEFKSSLFCISASIVTTFPSLCPNSLYAASHLALTSDKLLALRARMTTLDPAFANRIAVEAPIPDDAPVIRAGMSVWAEAGDLEGQGQIGGFMRDQE